MAFIMHMPKSFKIGDSADVRINGSPERLTWTDVHTLTIDPDDHRRILRKTYVGGGLIEFICSDDEGELPLDEKMGGAVVSIGEPSPNKPTFNPTLKNPKERES